MIYRLNNCLGITLFRFLRWKVEIWFIPRNETVKSHRHPNVDSWLWFIKGLLLIRRNQKLKYHKGFGLYKIDHNDWHGFSSVLRSAIFINFQTWISKEITSPSLDIEYYAK